MDSSSPNVSKITRADSRARVRVGTHFPIFFQIHRRAWGEILVSICTDSL